MRFDDMSHDAGRLRNPKTSDHMGLGMNSDSDSDSVLRNSFISWRVMKS